MKRERERSRETWRDKETDGGMRRQIEREREREPDRQTDRDRDRERESIERGGVSETQTETRPITETSGSPEIQAYRAKERKRYKMDWSTLANTWAVIWGGAKRMGEEENVPENDNFWTPPKELLVCSVVDFCTGKTKH